MKITVFRSASDSATAFKPYLWKKSRKSGDVVFAVNDTQLGAAVLNRQIIINTPCQVKMNFLVIVAHPLSAVTVREFQK